MMCSIHQPDYIPYIGYFYKISKSKIFVFLDDVQFSNDNMHHWNKIKTPQGECRLKIPVDYKFGDNINQVRTKDELGWKEKHIKTIEMNYKKAPYFQDVFPGFASLLLKDYQNLSLMNIALNKYFCKGFGFEIEFILSSKMNIDSFKEDRVIDICCAIGADKYISGHGAKAYQDENNFTKNGLKLVYTDYTPFEYPQLWGEFIPNLSILDYVLNCGFKPFYVKE